MDSSKKMARAAATAATDLTDDLIVEILSRLPVKSICRFKCVSRHWRRLITHPEHRRNIPQTISGFFYPHGHYPVNHKNQRTETSIPQYIGIRGTEEPPFLDPSLPFLPGYRSIVPSDCCGGLLLNKCWKVNPIDEFNYVVCNPASNQWMVLPEPEPLDNNSAMGALCLGFDPNASSHFHVFRLIMENECGYFTDLHIYSSETGAWSHRGIGWSESDEDENMVVEERGVFMNGVLHLLSLDATILTVDTEGKKWRIIPLLDSMSFLNHYNCFIGFIGQSQGCLCYINTRRSDISFKMSVWILEDYNAGRWMFKYNVSTSQLFREVDPMLQRDYSLIAIHPNCIVIFLVWKRANLLMSYDMDHGKVYDICTLTEPMNDVFLPYVPFFSDSLADED